MKQRLALSFFSRRANRFAFLLSSIVLVGLFAYSHLLKRSNAQGRKPDDAFVKFILWPSFIKCSSAFVTSLNL